MPCVTAHIDGARLLASDPLRAVFTDFHGIKIAGAIKSQQQNTGPA